MKKYQKIFSFLIVFMFMGTSCFYYNNYVKGSGEVKVSARENVKSKNYISMMYETEAGSGEYIEAIDSEWPSDGYTFNSTLSKCENGSNILWDDTNKQLIVNTNKSDKCYVYFDVYIADASVDWEYELDDASNTIILTKYIGSEPDVVVHNVYAVDDVVYKNVMMGETRYNRNLDILMSGPFVVDNITSVMFENGVKAPENASAMLLRNDDVNTPLEYIDVRGLDVTGVTDMSSMFGYNNITSLDLNGWDTSNVTDMANMFSGCNKLTSLDLSGWDTSNVTDMYEMFSTCYVLETIYASDLWNTDAVSSSDSMFYRCTSLKGDIAYNSSYVDKTYATISGGYLTYKAAPNKK